MLRSKLKLSECVHSENNLAMLHSLRSCLFLLKLNRFFSHPVNMSLDSATV